MEVKNLCPRGAQGCELGKNEECRSPGLISLIPFCIGSFCPIPPVMIVLRATRVGLSVVVVIVVVAVAVVSFLVSFSSETSSNMFKIL